MKLNRLLRDHRPTPDGPRLMTKDERRSRVIRGAQWSESQGVWLGFLFDGYHVTMFDGRTTRERALKDASDHMGRIFSEELPRRRWKPAQA